MFTRRTLSFLVMFWVGATCPSQSPAQVSQKYGQFGDLIPDCDASSGATALYVAAKSFGLHPDLNAIASQTHLNEHGVTLRGLREAAIANDLYAMVYYQADGNWNNIPARSIIQCQNNKFLFVVAKANDGLDVVDDETRRIILGKELSKLWTRTIIELRPTIASARQKKIEFSVTESTSGSTPEIVQQELGAIPGDTQFVTELELRNKSRVVFKLTDVLPSCGCTTVSKSGDEMRPGESIQLMFDLHTRGLHGLVQKQVFIKIKGADGVEKACLYKLHAEIIGEERLYSQPSQPVFDGIAGEPIPAKEVFVSREGDAPVRFLSAKSTSSLFAVTSIDLRPSDPNQSRVRLKVTPLSPMARGTFEETIYVETAGSLYKVLEIPFIVKVGSSFQMEPSAIFDDDVKSPRTLEKKIHIYSAKHHPFQVKNLEVVPHTLGSISCDDRNEYDKILTFKLSTDQSSVTEFLRGTIEAQTNGEFQESLSIPIVMQVSKRK